MTTTTPKPREGQVAGFPKEQAVMLTESNAYRAKSIRRTGTDEVPVLFHFRKRCMGMHSYVHTIEATDGIEKVIRPADFKEWEIVECRYPGYLEDLYDSACSAYRWNSFDPEERAQTSAAMKSSCVPTCLPFPKKNGNNTRKATGSAFPTCSAACHGVRARL